MNTNMGDLVKMRDNAISIAAIACQLDRDKRYEEAFNKYIECLGYFNYVVKCKLYIIV